MVREFLVILRTLPYDCGILSNLGLFEFLEMNMNKISYGYPHHISIATIVSTRHTLCSVKRWFLLRY